MLRRVLGVSLLSCALLAATLDGAEARGLNSAPTPVELANPGISRSITRALPIEVQESSVKIDRSFKPGMPIVYPNGKLVRGQKVTPLVSYCTNLNFAAIPGVWATSTARGCAVFGYNGYKRYYSWGANQTTHGYACVQAKAFDDIGDSAWRGMGCGTHGSGIFLWGNVLAEPQIRAKAVPPLPYGGIWGGGKGGDSAWGCTTQKFLTPPSLSNNAGRIKCAHIFSGHQMRAVVELGPLRKYGAWVGQGKWSTAVYSPGKTVTSITFQRR